MRLHNFCEINKKGADEDLFQIQQLFQRNIQSSQENSPEKNIFWKYHRRNPCQEFVNRIHKSKFTRLSLGNLDI